MKWNVDDYHKHAAYVSASGQNLLALLHPRAGERVLDIGCGDGELAEQIQQKGCAVVGIDASPQMVAAAEKRGIDARVMRAEDLNYHEQFDAVFSNAALHWMPNADKVLRNVHRALRPGGRFCAEMGARGNVGIIMRALYARLAERGLDGDRYNLWYFPGRDEYESRLKHAGFSIASIEVFERPTLLPTDISGWLLTFAKNFLRDIPAHEHEAFAQRVMADTADTLRGRGGEWYADYVRLRFHACKR